MFADIHATGNATLGGTLNAQLVNGFVPVAGQSFQVLTYASHTGAFAKVTTKPPAAGVTFTPDYLTTEFDLNA
jgi:hypothetical protein